MLDETAIGIVFSKDRNKVLLVKRRDTPVWVLPGGGIDEGETPSEAAKREVLEETGLVVSIERQIGKYFPTNRLGKITYVFQCIPLEGDIQTTPESKEVKFFNLYDLPSSFFFIHNYWLQDALAKHPAPLEKKLEGVTYFNLFKNLILHPWIVLRYFLSKLGLPWNSR